MSRIIALTGATGFIGGALVHRLRAANWQIRALVRPTSKRDHLACLGVHWVKGDLDDLESLRCLVRNTYAVVHCAGAVRSASSAYFTHVNSHGVVRLVQAATEQHPMPRFLLVSSLTAREPHLSPYAASKRQGEEALATGAGQMPWAVLRPPPVYGPGDKEMLPLFRWIYRGIAPVLSPNDARFSMLYISDLVDAIAQWLAFGSAMQRVFELHDGQRNGYGWEDLIHTIVRLRGRRVHRIPIPSPLLAQLARLNTITAQLTGYTPMLTPGKVRELRHLNWVCDNTMFSSETGWSPQVLLEEGLRRTLAARCRPK